MHYKKIYRINLLDKCTGWPADLKNLGNVEKTGFGRTGKIREF